MLTKRAIRTLLLFALLAAAMPAFPADMEMWSCKQPGQRRNVLYLADRGAQSYVKLSGQRVPVQISSEDGETRWSWGHNSVLLKADGTGQYFEGDTPKMKLKCKRMGNDG